VAKQTGLNADCKVYAGLHDSNASYLRYLRNQNDLGTDKTKSQFTVISSGTWTILMSSNSSAKLDEHKDMLANVDVLGHPVACARFMGGREYEHICAQLGGDREQDYSPQALQFVLTQQYMVSPDFSAGNGPFGGKTPIISAPKHSQYAQAIATLYCALMIDYQLTQLSASGAIYIEGAFLQNSLMCQLVAQLRHDQPVLLSTDNSGTVQGAALLSQWHQNKVEVEQSVCAPSEFTQLAEYKQLWLDLVNK
jgi:sugar (pentulose or hexulose) kinase